MLNFLLLDFFNDAINTIFRNVPDALRYCLILGFLALGFLFLAKTFNMKKDSADKEPIKYGKLVLAILFIGLAFAYAFLR